MNCEREISYILAVPFNKYVNDSCFPDCWKVSSMVPYLRMLGKGIQLKTTVLYTASLLSVVCKVFEKVIDNHLGKGGLFPNFQDGFRSS